MWKSSCVCVHWEVTQAVKHQNIKDFDNLTDALLLVNTILNKAVVQWTPAHSNIQGIEEAGRLTKEKERMQQIDRSLVQKETKNELTAIYTNWHPKQKQMMSAKNF